MNPQSVSSVLAELSKQIIEVKNIFNEYWDKYYTYVRDIEPPELFDNIVDQIVSVVDCLNNVGKKSDDELLTIARNSHVNAVKATANLLLNIIHNIDEEITEISSKIMVGEMKRGLELLRDARNQKDIAVSLYERDNPECIIKMKSALSLYDSALNEAGVVKPIAEARIKSEKRSRRLTRIGIILAIILALIAFFKEEIKILFTKTQGGQKIEHVGDTLR